MPNEEVRQELMDIFVEQLPKLRKLVGVTQQQISTAVGISRQTFCSIEQNKEDGRKITWNTYLSLMLFFYANKVSRKYIGSKKEYLEKLIDELNFFDNEDEELL